MLQQLVVVAAAVEQVDEEGGVKAVAAVAADNQLDNILIGLIISLLAQDTS